MIHLLSEASRCLLCTDAPCTAACPRHLDPARGIRALRFENDSIAGLFFSSSACADCDAPCQRACLHYDMPIRIQKMSQSVEPVADKPNADLSIDFCGVHCENPFFLASSVIGNCYEMIAKALDMGWAGVMYKTISYETIREVSPRFDTVDREGQPFVGFRNMEQLSEHHAEEDFATIARLKHDYPTKVIVASIMGRNEEEWTRLACLAREAGADMIECNFSCPQMTVEGMGSDVGQNCDLVRAYTEATKRGAGEVPVLAKMTPNITHIEEPAYAAIQGGADGIAAINTIKSITFKERSSVSGKKTISGYSGKAVKPIAQRMILDMARNPKTAHIPMSGIGGIETWKDAIEYIRIGCANVQVCTAVMEYGYRIIDDLLLGLQDHMRRAGTKHLSEEVGLSLKVFVDPSELDRDTKVLPKFDRDRCVGCGRCATSCYDGGHQAIAFDMVTRRPKLDGHRCVGCHLCLLVCPTGAIQSTNRIHK